MGGLTTPVSACLLIAFSFVHNLPLFVFFLTKHFIAKKKKNKLSKSSVSHNVFAVEGFEIFQKLPKPDGDMT